MLRKLLKYDLRAILKYWWIAAVTTVGLAGISGVLIRILKVENTRYTALQVMSVMALVFCVLGIALLSVISWVLILVRFYKHFFTDEGYLTFTLPVKKHQLLTSKLLMALITHFITCVVIILDFVLALFIGFAEEIFRAEFWQDVQILWQELSEVLRQVGGGYVALYILEYLLVLLTASVASTLVIYLCITVAAIISRKYKILTAIALYYGYSFISTGAVRILLADGNMYSLFFRIADLGVESTKMALGLLGLIGLGVYVLAAAGLYMLESYLLERKLNLV